MIKNKLEKIFQVLQDLHALGAYDTNIAGAIGEIYAEEVLGLIKAPRGTKGYDGTINSRKVSVKTKEHDRTPKSRAYAQIEAKNFDLIDDLLLVFIHNNESCSHLGPFALAEIKHLGKTSAKRTSLRFYQKDLEAINQALKF